MPPVSASKARPSTLIDVLGHVRDAFDATADATLIQIGAQYKESFGAGHGPKVLFVPEAPGTGGAMGGALSLGYPAAQTHGCDVYVRGDEETTDDLDRFKLLYALSDRVVGLVATAASGRLTWGACADDSPLRTPSALGCALAFSFAYTRNVRHDADRWKAPPRDATGALLTSPRTMAVADAAPFLPTSPGADSGTVDDITITTATE